MISDAGVDRLHEAIRSLGYTTNRQSREIAELLATLNLSGVVGGDAVPCGWQVHYARWRQDRWDNIEKDVYDFYVEAKRDRMSVREIFTKASLAKGNGHGN